MAAAAMAAAESGPAMAAAESGPAAGRSFPYLRYALNRVAQFRRQRARAAW